MSDPGPAPSTSTLVPMRVRFDQRRYLHHELNRWLVDHPADEGAEPSAVRVAPLLHVSGGPDQDGKATPWQIIVGSSRVTVQGDREVQIESLASFVWRETADGSFAPVIFQSDDDDEAAAIRKRLQIATLPYRNTAEWATNQAAAAGVVKTLCELSRNAMANFRDARYTLEQRLADSSVGDTATGDHTTVVAALLVLNVIAGRASDLLLIIEREGLYVWLTDDEVYRAYRKLRDPLLLNNTAPADQNLRPWIGLHDAAMRQCEAIHVQLDAESATMRSLIASATSISTSREADAQTRFNVLAAIISIGLGLPALVLTLYGASTVVPFTSPERWVAFAPVAVALFFAAGLAALQGYRMKRGGLWTWGAIGILGVLLLLLLIAGLIVPKI